MAKTVKVTSLVNQETDAGAMPALGATPTAGVAYTTKLFKDAQLAVGGTTGPIALPAGTKGFCYRIKSESPGASSNFSIAITNAVPETLTLLPKVDADGKIKGALEAGLGTDPVTVTITDLDAVHASPTDYTFEAWA